MHKGLLYQGVARDIFGHVSDAIYANMTRIIDEPAAALFQHTLQLLRQGRVQKSKVAHNVMAYKFSSADTKKVHLNVAANDTVQPSPEQLSSLSSEATSEGQTWTDSEVQIQSSGAVLQLPCLTGPSVCKSCRRDRRWTLQGHAFDPEESTVYLYGNSRRLKELSNMAAAA